MRILFKILSISFLLTPFLMFAQDTKTYTTLSNIPNFKEVKIESIAGFINLLVEWTIGIGGALAVIMIIWGGIQIMISDAEGSKTAGKQKIESAIWGVIIGLTSYLLLVTINPNLVDLNFAVSKIQNIEKSPAIGENSGLQPAPSNTPAPQTPPAGTQNNAPIGENSATAPSPATGNHTAIPNTIAIKSDSNKQIDSSMVPGLTQMQTNLSSMGINWQVTEAYPPKYTHASTCHQTGTCIDANFTSTTATPENIKTFISAASSAGFTPVYEVETEAECKRLKQGGVTNVVYLPGRISAAHFSVYSTPPKTISNC